jgi:hypothetical protein
MALSPLATIDDLAEWLGSTVASLDIARAEAVLSAVSSLVRSEANRTWENEGAPEDIRVVTLQASARMYRNPEGFVQKSIGDVSVSYGGRSSLILLPEERAIIARHRRTLQGLGTISVTRNEHAPATGWVPVADSDHHFPWY